MTARGVITRWNVAWGWTGQKKPLKRAERERTGIQITMALPGAVLVVIRNGMAWRRRRAGENCGLEREMKEFRV